MPQQEGDGVGPDTRRVGRNLGRRGIEGVVDDGPGDWASLVEDFVQQETGDGSTTGEGRGRKERVVGKEVAMSGWGGMISRC